MTEEQLKQTRELFLQEIPPENLAGAKWLLGRGMIKDCHIHAFLCQKFYNEELNKTKETGRKYGDKKQAIVAVQKRVPLSERRIKSIIK